MNFERNIKQRLSSATKQMVDPALYERLLQNIPVREERTVPMKTATNISALPSSQKRHWLSYAGAAVAACLILVGGLFGGRYYVHNYTVDSVVDIDVNPGIELTTNANNRVLSVKAVNRDAETVLDGMNLKNTELKVAVNALVGSMVQHGYLGQGENALLVTVQNENAQKASHVRNEILSNLSVSLKENNVSVAVVNQTVTDKTTTSTAGTDAVSLAEKQGISFGKALFILRLCEKDPSLNAASLTPLSLRELAALVTEKNLDIRDIVDYDEDDSLWENLKDAVENADDDHKANLTNAPVSADRAKEIALKHANVTAKDAFFLLAEFDRDDGVIFYEVDFTAGNYEYEYEIHAETGAVLKAEKEAVKNPTTKTSSGQSPSLSLAEAKNIALKHAGVAAKDAVFEKAERDSDNGIALYEIEFKANGTEYEYEINARTGTVLKAEKEQDDDISTTYKPTSTNPSVSAKISADKAKSIALNHAGVAEKNATFHKVKLDIEDNVLVYEVEFVAGGTEYEYEINAQTGRILSCD